MQQPPYPEGIQENRISDILSTLNCRLAQTTKWFGAGSVTERFITVKYTTG